MNKDENFIQKFKNKINIKKQALQTEEELYDKKILREIDNTPVNQNDFISSLKFIIMIAAMSLICVFGYSYLQDSNGDLLKNEIENYLVSDNFIRSFFSKNLQYRLTIGNIWNTIVDTAQTDEQIIYYISDYDNSFEKLSYNKNSEKRAIKSKDNLLYAKYKIEDGMAKELEFKSIEKFSKYKILLMDIINSNLNNPSAFPRESDIRALSKEFGFEYIKGDFHSYNGNIFDKNIKEIKINDGENEKKDYDKDKENLQKLINILENLSKEYIKGYTFTIIIPKESLNFVVFEKDYRFIEYFGIKKLIEFSTIFGSVLLFVIISALITPIIKQNKIPLIKAFNRAFIITKLLVTAFIYTITVLIASGFQFTREININSNFQFLEGKDRLALSFLIGKGQFYYSFAIPIAFFTFLFVYLIMVNLKYIHYKGFIDAFFKKTVSGNIFIIILKFIKNIFSNFKKKFKSGSEKLYKDFFKSYKRKIMLFILINAFLLFMMMIFSFSGFPAVFLMILYIVYLFFIYRYINSFLSNLALVHETTKNIAQGQFNSSIDENLGILSQIAENINSINKGFKIALEEEIKSQNMKTQLISNVSHDLKTPLTSIINYSDLLKNTALKEDEKNEYINIIYQKSQRLKILIEDLFEASKASSGNIKLNIERLDIIALFRQSLAEMDEKINSSNLKFKLNLPDKKVFCNIDGLRTYRIFSNIISNITKYTLANTRVYIDFEETDNEISLEFKNISNYEMDFNEDEIMQRFQRGDKSRTKEGSGLGLAIAKSLIELQGGKIQLKIDGDLFKLKAIFQKND